MPPPPSPSKHPLALRFSMTSLGFVLVISSLLLKGAGTLWIQKQVSDLKREHSYLGNDFPEIWTIERKPVLMTFDNPKHFRLDTEDGEAEWAALIPGNDGVIHLGPYRQPYTISMFHQLKCLDVIRQEMTKKRGKVGVASRNREKRQASPSEDDSRGEAGEAGGGGVFGTSAGSPDSNDLRLEVGEDSSDEDSGPSELSRHCLNYIRQMVMCRGDLELESFQFASHKNPIDWRGVYECKDWEAVYAEAKQNQKEYQEWLKVEGLNE